MDMHVLANLGAKLAQDHIAPAMHRSWSESKKQNTNDAP
jgi:hypothetical protein